MAIAIRSNSQISDPLPSAGAFTAARAVRETGLAGASRPRLLDRVREAIRARHHRAKRPQRLPVVPTRDEVRAVLQRLDGVSRLMALLLYGAGLRLLECCHLRVKDIDFATNQIVIRDGKGRKDRVTLLPAAVIQNYAARYRSSREIELGDERRTRRAQLSGTTQPAVPGNPEVPRPCPRWIGLAASSLSDHRNTMPKPRKTLRVQLPSYLAPRLTWRKGLLSAVRTAKRTRGLVYDESDRLALSIRLYLIGRNLDRIDVDNRLKDVMDALQGQIGGGGKKIKTPRDPIIRNDRQVWRVTTEKLKRPPKLKPTAGGHLTISRLRSAPS